MSETTQALAVATAPPPAPLMKPAEVVAQLTAVTELMKLAMSDGNDFGTIPGCGPKPTLLKPGAEKLNVLFRLAPTYKTEITQLEGPHREYRVTCTLTHIPTGTVRAQGEGSCSTLESKYRWRNADRACPACGKPAIKRSKFPPRGAPAGTDPGWYCYDKIGGCGANFQANDQQIASQTTGRTENPDIADQFNTCLKMACKRALVAATLNATGASALFTQDIEDGDKPESDAPQHRQNGNGAKPAQAAAQPAAQQSAKSGVFSDTVSTIEEKTYQRTVKRGGKDVKEPSNYWIIHTAGGTPLTTFSSTAKARCEAAIAGAETLEFVWEDNGRGINLKQINEPQVVEGEVVL